MSDNVLHEFTGRLARHAAQDGDDAGVAEDVGGVGWLRGVKERALMVEFRMKDGSVTALGYAWLERVEFSPEAGITLCFTNQTVRISGRNLNAEVRPNVRLLDGLVRHRISWLREADQAKALAADTHAPVIERIVVES